ncbi:MAG: ABC transporter permease [Actinobacteria bacterium]|nr:ABC transporter permease [Actinomycetota bacterium]
MSRATLERKPPAIPSSGSPDRRSWRRDPWRRPRILEAVTWGYLAWSLLPLLVAILISFNQGRSNASIQGGLSFAWWWGDPEDSLFHDPELHAAIWQSIRLSISTMLIAVPLGVAFALGLDRWRGRGSGTTNFTMLLSFVMPEIVLGVAMFMVIAFVLRFIPLGTLAQIIGLVTYQLSYPVIIVRARMLSIGKEYEEAAMDLGAPPRAAIRRILLPLLYPAIFASFAIVFADSLDDFVTVRYLSGPASSEPLSVKIYNFSRGAPTPAINAAATFMLLTTTLVVLLGYLGYRAATRGQRREGIQSLAGQL